MHYKYKIMKRTHHYNTENYIFLFFTTESESGFQMNVSLSDDQDNDSSPNESTDEELTDDMSQIAVDPARTAAVDPARTRTVDPARTRN